MAAEAHVDWLLDRMSECSCGERVLVDARGLKWAAVVSPASRMVVRGALHVHWAQKWPSAPWLGLGGLYVEWIERYEALEVWL